MCPCAALVVGWVVLVVAGFAVVDVVDDRPLVVVLFEAKEPEAAGPQGDGRNEKAATAASTLR